MNENCGECGQPYPEPPVGSIGVGADGRLWQRFKEGEFGWGYSVNYGGDGGGYLWTMVPKPWRQLRFDHEESPGE